MANREPEALDVGLGALGSLLMFAGWVLAVVPLFHHVREFLLPVVLGIIGFGIVLVPAGLDFFGGPGRKRGASVVIASMLPAAALFIIAVIAFPLTTPFRIAAVIAEFAGMAIYGWAFWSYQRGVAARSNRPRGHA